MPTPISAVEYKTLSQKIELDSKPDFPAGDAAKFFESSPFTKSRDYFRVEMITPDQKAEYEAKMGINPESTAVLVGDPYDMSDVGGGDTVHQNFYFRGEKMPDTVMKVIVSTPKGGDSVVSAEALRLGQDQLKIFEAAVKITAMSGQTGTNGFVL